MYSKNRTFGAYLYPKGFLVGYYLNYLLSERFPEGTTLQKQSTKKKLDTCATIIR